MIRYKVTRKSVRFNRQTYHMGEYLPKSFSERDMYRIMYPSRITKVEVPDEEVSPVITEGTNVAKSVPVAPVKQTGAPLSGITKVVSVKK